MVFQCKDWYGSHMVDAEAELRARAWLGLVGYPQRYPIGLKYLWDVALYDFSPFSDLPL